MIAVLFSPTDSIAKQQAISTSLGSRDIGPPQKPERIAVCGNQTSVRLFDHFLGDDQQLLLLFDPQCLFRS
jgi:hypothetical protein